MKNQLKAYDKHIVVAYIIQVAYSYVAPVLFLLGINASIVSKIQLSSSVIGIAVIGFFVYAIFEDTKQIESAGKEAPSKWWILLLPVYLWKRANVLKQKQSAFWCFIGTMVISMILSSVISTIVVSSLA